MPDEGTPRSFAALIFIPPGSTAPGRLTPTVWPAATLGAPQTMVRGVSSSTSTVHTESLSASGCFSQVSTLPTTKHSNTASSGGTPTRATRSTSVPVRANREASSSMGRSIDTYSRNHDTGALIAASLWAVEE